MAKKTLQKASAIRVAALSGLITVAPGWQKFQDTVAHHSLHNILTKDGCRPAKQLKKHYPGLGYLLLLEEALGVSEFRKLCPLVLPVNDRLVTTFLSTNDRLTKDDLSINDRNALCQSLFTHYCKWQHTRARRLWPSDIGEQTDAVLKVAVPPVLTKPGSWLFCQAYLQVRYGLSGSKPIANHKKLILPVLRLVSHDDEYGPDVEDYEKGNAVIDCISQIDAALQHSAVRPHLCNLARAFSNSQRSASMRSSTLAAAPEQSARSQAPPDYDLDTPIAQLVSVRTGNALGRKGYLRFRHLHDIPENQLRLIPNFGERALWEVKEALRQVIAAMQARQQANRRQLEQEKRLARLQQTSS